MRSLEGKTAWITGAGTGIGQAAAAALAGAGMHVVLSGRREAPLEEVRARIAAAGGSAEIAPLDVSDKQAVADVAADILARHGGLDTLVNNAGINVRERRWHELTPDNWDKVVAIDLNGAFYCIHAVLPAMRAAGEGLVINVSSWAGRYTSYVAGGLYSAAKHAMLSMGESLNMEEGNNGIRCCTICPGEVATPILDQRPVQLSDADKARMVQTEDMGELFLFVARMGAHVCLNEILVSPTWDRQMAGATDMTPGGD